MPKILIPLALLLFISCQHTPEIPKLEIIKAALPLAVNVVEDNSQFKDYWYQGKAELSSFELEQARYGELHKGEAVLIYVTEEFSKSKQVKLDNPSAYPEDAIPILKLNATKKFNTGIYPYSIMQSVFTPVDWKNHPNSLKLTASSQEWCGHTFTQLNHDKNQYQLKLLSYFESEGDREEVVDDVLLEDEVWNRIRIAPESLPQGDVEIIPSTIFSRLRHTDIRPHKAQASLLVDGEKDWISYQINYPALKRQLTIHFSQSFPHEIQGWEESHSSGYGPNARTLTTKAKRKKSLMLDYWRHNSNEDLDKRADLGLE